MSALEPKRHSRSTSTYNTFRRFVGGSGIYIPPPLKLNGNHRRGPSSGGRTGDESGGFRTTGGHQSTTRPGNGERLAGDSAGPSSRHAESRDEYMPSHAGGSGTQWTIGNRTTEPQAGGLVGATDRNTMMSGGTDPRRFTDDDIDERRMEGHEMNFGGTQQPVSMDNTIKGADEQSRNVGVGMMEGAVDNEWDYNDDLGGLPFSSPTEKARAGTLMKQGQNQIATPPGLSMPNSPDTVPANRRHSAFVSPTETTTKVASRNQRDMDFYDYMNAHTAMRSNVDGRGIVKTPVPVKSVMTSVADALEQEARSQSPAGESERPRMGRVASYESFRCGSQDPEVPILRGSKILVAPISPPPKPQNQYRSAHGQRIPYQTADSHAERKRASELQTSLPELQTDFSNADESLERGALLSPLSPFHLKSPFPEMYPPILSLQSPEVTPAPAPEPSPIVPTLHPILVPVRQEDGSDIWMQSITPLSPSKQDAIYQETLGSYHGNTRGQFESLERVQKWDQGPIHRARYEDDHQLFSPTSTAAASDFFGMNPLSPRQAPSPQKYMMSPTSFGRMDPMSPSAMYPSFNPFESQPTVKARYSAGYDQYAVNTNGSTNRSSSGSGQFAGSGSTSGPSPEFPSNPRRSHHHHYSYGSNGTNTSVEAESDMYWEHILTGMDPKRNSGSSVGTNSYGPHEMSSPTFHSVTSRPENGGFPNTDLRGSPTHRVSMRTSPLRGNSSQSPSPTRLPPIQNKQRPVIDTSVALKFGYGGLAGSAHRRTTSLTPTSLLSGDNIWAAPRDAILSPTTAVNRSSKVYGLDDGYPSGFADGYANGGQRWSDGGWQSRLEGVGSPVRGVQNGESLHMRFADSRQDSAVGIGEKEFEGGIRNGYVGAENVGNGNGHVGTLQYSYSEVLKHKSGAVNGGQ